MSPTLLGDLKFMVPEGKTPTLEFANFEVGGNMVYVTYKILLSVFASNINKETYFFFVEGNYLSEFQIYVSYMCRSKNLIVTHLCDLCIS